MQRIDCLTSIKIVVFSVLSHLAIQNTTVQNNVTIDWGHQENISKTTPTLQLVENPMVRPSSPIHEDVLQSFVENPQRKNNEFVT